MPIGDLLAQISGEAQPPTTPAVPRPSVNPAQKRKADGELLRNGDKSIRRDQISANSSRPISQMKRPRNLDIPTSNSKSGSLTPSSSRSQAHESKDASPVTTPRVDPSKPPKKGSYAEIMARGKAAQATLGQVGRIQHKPIEKGLNRRERLEIKGQTLQAQRGINGKVRLAGQTPLKDGRNGVRENNGKVSKGQAVAPEKKAKKAVVTTTGYTGTARPNPSSMKHSRAYPAAGRGPSNSRDHPSSRRHNYASEEDDEEEEEDYESDVSSDMEAAVFEVDEEEEAAARFARREDAEALKEENRLKREKEEKRRKLMELAKKRR